MHAVILGDKLLFLGLDFVNNHTIVLNVVHFYRNNTRVCKFKINYLCVKFDQYKS